MQKGEAVKLRRALKIRISNKEQGMLNVEAANGNLHQADYTTHVQFGTLKFEIPCSLFNIPH